MKNKNINISVIGLGYVGLPLAVSLSKHFKVIGYDKKSERIKELRNSLDTSKEISSKTLENSSLILTKQMSREEAISELEMPAYNEDEMQKDFKFVAKKLDLTETELKKLFDGKNRTYKDYKNNMFLINLGAKIMTLFNENHQLMK